MSARCVMYLLRGDIDIEPIGKLQNLELVAKDEEV